MLSTDEILLHQLCTSEGSACLGFRHVIFDYVMSYNSLTIIGCPFFSLIIILNSFCMGNIIILAYVNLSILTFTAPFTQLTHHPFSPRLRKYALCFWVTTSPLFLLHTFNDSSSSLQTSLFVTLHRLPLYSPNRFIVKK